MYADGVVKAQAKPVITLAASTCPYPVAKPVATVAMLQTAHVTTLIVRLSFLSTKPPANRDAVAKRRVKPTEARTPY